MNKKLILISALLFSFNGWAEDVNGTMRCTIKDQAILEMNDGVSKRYSAYKGFYKIGDIIPFEYELSEQNSELVIRMGFDANDRTDGKYPLFFWYYDITTTKKLKPLKITGVSIPERFVIYYNTMKRDSIQIRDDEIDATNGNSKLILTRYFKNDWNGIVTQTLPGVSYATSLDCKQGIDQYDELLEALDDLAIENE